MVRRITDEDVGIKVLYNIQDVVPDMETSTIVDIVAIHGIGAHPDYTWSKLREDGGEKRYVTWLQDRNMLPGIVPNTRIMRYGYHSQWFGDDAITQKASTVAQDLLLSLRRRRRDCVDRPLIFVSHCFGGLAVLKAINEAKRNESKWPSIYQSTTGMVFFGTPFRGAPGMEASVMLQAALKEYAEDEIQIESLAILAPGNEYLIDLLDTFMETRQEKNKASIACFWEQKPSNVGRIVGGLKRQTFVVNESSGCLDQAESTEKYSLSRDHFNMNKFGSSSEEDWLTVSEVIEEMVKQAPEILAARAASESVSRYYEVPSVMASRFFGRQEFLKKLDSNLECPQGDGKPSTVILRALGGQGKSQIALEFCRRFRDRYRGVFWIDATSRVTAERSFQRMAYVLDKQISAVLEDSTGRVKFVLNTIRGWEESWLLVYDNYDDPENFSDIANFLPTGGSGAIIITSRHGGSMALGKLLEVPSMTDDGGLDLLLRDCPLEWVSQYEQQGRAIVERLGGLALAIEQAAAYINYRKMTLPVFLAEYEKKRQTVLEYIRKELWPYQKLKEGSSEPEGMSAFATWELLFDQIEPKDSMRKEFITEFIHTSAFLEPSNIGEYLFETYFSEAEAKARWIEVFANSSGTMFSCRTNGEAKPSHDISTDENSHNGWNKDHFWAIIWHLNQISLIQDVNPSSDDQPASFSIHPLIRDWLQLRRLPVFKLNSLRAAVDIVRTNLRSSLIARANFSRREELIAHMDECVLNVDRSSISQNEAAQDFATISSFPFAEFYVACGRYGSAVDMCQRCVDSRYKQYGEDSEAYIRSLSSLASCYYFDGQYVNAAELNEKVYQLRLSASGPHHHDTLSALQKLALARHEQGKYQDSRLLLEEILESRSTLLGEKHPDTLSSMQNLAACLSSLGLLHEAIALKHKTYQLRVEVLGEKDPATVASLGELALSYTGLGQYQEGVALNTDLLSLSREIYGPKHPQVLRAMNNLGSSYAQLGKPKDAVALVELVCGLASESLGVYHPATLNYQQNLAVSYINIGRYEKSMTLHQYLLEVQSRILGSDHPETCASMLSLSACLLYMGKLHEALDLAEQTYSLMARVHGEEHMNTLNALYTIASAKSALGQKQQAEIMLKTVIQICKRTVGENHPHTISSIATYSNVLIDLGRHNESLKILDDVLARKTGKIDYGRLDVQMLLSNLSGLYSKLGHHSESVELDQGIVDLRTHILGEEHPDTLRSLNNLAMGYYNTGRFDDALPMLQKNLELRTNILGAENLETLSSKENLRGIYDVIGRKEDSLSLRKEITNTRIKMLGEGHADSVECIVDLCMKLNDLNRLEEGRQWSERLHRIRVASCGEYHQDTLEAKAILALVQARLNHKQEASELCEALLKCELSDVTEKGLDCMGTLADIFWMSDNQKLACSLNYRFVEGSKARFGADDVKTKKAFNSFVVNLKKHPM